MKNSFTLSGGENWPLFVLAHGAGAGSDSPFMQAMAEKLEQLGVATARFNFPYMERSKADGKRRPPDKIPSLIKDYSEKLALINRPCVIGGKSMGGRVASLLMAENPELAAACVCLGYPFHPAGKPERLRTDHLAAIKKPLLIVQGTRDALGNQQEVTGYALPDCIQWLWLDDGDHDLKPRKASGFTHEQHLQAAAERIAAFVKQQLA